MRTIPINLTILIMAVVSTANRASAQFVKIDDFTNATPGTLNHRVSDGPSNGVWNLETSASSVVIAASTTPGAGQPGSGTPLSPQALAIASTSTDGAAYIPLPTPIPTSS